MAKPRRITFTEEFEPVLLNAWGAYQERLEGSLLGRTRAAVTEIRRLYRFKDTPYPSLLDYSQARYRAGYLSAFGQRHAYLPYAHLKQVQEQFPDAIPEPDTAGELSVTVLGAAAAVEVYGVVLFYNEVSHRLKRLRLNLVEKVSEWKPTRYLVFDLLKRKFPRLDIISNDIDVDLTQESCVQKFANYHDELVKTRILLVYNVLNEMEVQYRRMIYRNLSYIIRQSQDPLLLLLAEPTAIKAWSRIRWLREQLMRCSRVLIDDLDAEIDFTTEPTRIAFEGTGDGLNDRLFGRSMDSSRPVLQTSLKRRMMACVIEPLSPLSREQVYDQIRQLGRKRTSKGRFMPQQRDGGSQLPLIIGL
ncbi:MAG: hypothetical protein ACE5IG_05355 [Dehalococcoidia bacterium]